MGPMVKGNETHSFLATFDAIPYSSGVSELFAVQSMWSCTWVQMFVGLGHRLFSIIMVVLIRY